MATTSSSTSVGGTLKPFRRAFCAARETGRGSGASARVSSAASVLDFIVLDLHRVGKCFGRYSILKRVVMRHEPAPPLIRLMGPPIEWADDVRLLCPDLRDYRRHIDSRAARWNSLDHLRKNPDSDPTASCSGDLEDTLSLGRSRGKGGGAEQLP